VVAALGCAALALAGGAHAADDASSKASSLEEARQHAAKAKVHYDLGEFEKAAEEYIVVYRMRPLPALLFNIAQAYRQGGQHEKAKQFYRAYLRENPDAKIAAAVKKALKEIDELLAKERRTREAPPSGLREDIAGRAPASPVPAAPLPVPYTTPPAQPATATVVPASTAAPSVAPRPMRTPPAATAQALPNPVPSSALPATTVTAVRAAPSSARRTWTYALAGASVAMLSGGAIFAVRAKNIDDELLARPHPTTTADDLMSQSKSAHGISALLLGAGIASAAGAGVLFFWPTSSGAAVTGRF
jgi:tetratricopeptide (TPR) repeat protein